MLSGWGAPTLAVGTFLANASLTAGPETIPNPVLGWWPHLLKVMATLAALLGVLILALYLWKRYGPAGAGDDSMIKVLATHYLSPKKALILIRVGEEKFLLASVADQLTMLTPVSASEVDSASAPPLPPGFDGPRTQNSEPQTTAGVPPPQAGRCLKSMKGLAMTAVILVFLGTAAVPAWSLPTPGLDQFLGPDRLSLSLQILLLLTILSLAPAIMIMVTSFTRLAVVFSFLRHALGTQQVPPNQVIIGLALFLTFFIMAPVWQEIQEKAVSPYLAHKLKGEEALHKGLAPLRDFMLKQTREKDLALFISISKGPRPKTPQEVQVSALIPAFMISELRTAFEIGFLLYLPFLIIDMVVASVLLSMGMMMLPPVMVSLVFKVLLFVLVDGWHLMVGSLVKSFG